MNNIVVVDSSIVIKWIVEESDSDTAVALLVKWFSDGFVILAPILLAYEITNVLYQRIRRGDIPLDEAEQLLTYVLLKALKLDTSYDYALSVRATHLAHQFSLSATYDAHYLALAERNNCEFWTADTRLLNALNGKLPWVRKLNEYQASS
jgi:predicted nucleic acid-binding protein